MPTATNPYIAAEEIEAARASTPERAFRQEWLAEFIDESGGVFQGVFECVEPGMGEAHPVDGQRYYMGVDLARYEDWTVLCVLDASGRQVYLERFNQISWERQIAAIERVARRYAATVLVDSTGVGDPIYERLRALGLPVQPFHFTASSKDQLIDNLAILLEQQRLKLMDNEVQTNELISYEYEQLASGRLRANAPQGMHDDCVIALALAAWAMSARRALSVL
jgi:phage FluMu gp28-like protein